MIRTKTNNPAVSERRLKVNKRLEQFHQMEAYISRLQFASGKAGFQYGDYRKIYKALGYPESSELTFDYFYEKYDRQDIATAVIDRPVDATWRGNMNVVESEEPEEGSEFQERWNELNDELKIKQILTRADKLAGIGHYMVLLLGLSDVKAVEDLKKPVSGGELELMYLRPYGENKAKIIKYENNPSDKRYGLPLEYSIDMQRPGEAGGELSVASVVVHYTRVIHITDAKLLSEIKGRPRLRPIANRLEDLEKLMGGSSEMYWRGARPGYHAKPAEGFTFGDDEIEQLEDELDKFEHDLRRFMAVEGIEDIKSLSQQIADPSNHVDIQLQAISAQTGIPKRILVGSERGELSSSQDQDQWNTLIKTRREEYAEIYILRPFIDLCMEYGILPEVEEYNVQWEDLFAPSDEDKAKLGEIRARALKEYVAAVGADEILPPELVYKYILGMTEEEIEEAKETAEDYMKEEDRIMREAETMAGDLAQEELNRRAMEGQAIPAGGNGRVPKTVNPPPPPPPNQRGRNGRQMNGR